MQLAQRSSQPRAFSASSSVSRRQLVVSNALTRERKEETVKKLTGQLEKSTVVFGMRFKGLDVASIQKFRKGLPEDAYMTVCKNNLMKIACKEVPGWSVIEEKGATGENAWVFVPEESVRAAVKHYFAFEKSVFAEAKKNAAKGAEVKAPTEISCAVMDSKYLSPAELKKCENLPTKQELLTKIAASLNQPARKIALGAKAVPSKLAVAIQRISELDEDKTKTVAAFAKSA